MATANRDPKRTDTPAPEDVWKALGAALRQLAGTYGLRQAWIAETIGMSQPHVSYLLNQTKNERPRELTVSEVLRIEQRIRHEIDPGYVLGTMYRAAGVTQDAQHPADVVMTFPFLDPATRQDIAFLIKRGEERYRERFGDEDPAQPAAAPKTPASSPSRPSSAGSDSTPPAGRRSRRAH